MFSIRVPLISAFKKQLSGLTAVPTHSVTWNLKTPWASRKKIYTLIHTLPKNSFELKKFSKDFKGIHTFFINLRSYRVHYKQLFIRLRSYRESKDKGHSLNSRPNTVHWIYMCVCVYICMCVSSLSAYKTQILPSEHSWFRFYMWNGTESLIYSKPAFMCSVLKPSLPCQAFCVSVLALC